jgi:hypothetical protein
MLRCGCLYVGGVPIHLSLKFYKNVDMRIGQLISKKGGSNLETLPTGKNIFSQVYNSKLFKKILVPPKQH